MKFFSPTIFSLNCRKRLPHTAARLQDKLSVCLACQAACQTFSQLSHRMAFQWRLIEDQWTPHSQQLSGSAHTAVLSNILICRTICASNILHHISKKGSRGRLSSRAVWVWHTYVLRWMQFVFPSLGGLTPALRHNRSIKQTRIQDQVAGQSRRRRHITLNQSQELSCSACLYWFIARPEECLPPTCQQLIIGLVTADTCLQVTSQRADLPVVRKLRDEHLTVHALETKKWIKSVVIWH